MMTREVSSGCDTISGWLARGGWLGPPVEVCPEAELIAIEASATVRDDARHGLPPRLMAHQPTRFTAAQESKPSPSPGIRMSPSKLPKLLPSVWMTGAALEGGLTRAHSRWFPIRSTNLP